ncbi:haloacid dehalogenase-like hydrolase [bacterium]|nr:haloacid dehalogenase-like hydrolase [bacterium]
MKHLRHSLWIPLIVLTHSCAERTENKTDQGTAAVAATTPLPSWSEGPAQRIADYVKRVTSEKSVDFIPVADRIAVFDNDGTLWPEQPVPNQLVFARHWILSQAEAHPEWQEDPVLKALLEPGFSDWIGLGAEGLKKLMLKSHTGMTEEAFHQSVSIWSDTAIDPRYGQPYTRVLYQPMLELIDYLKAHGFTVFIVSGGGADFMRVWSEEAYGIPPFHVVGSYTGAEFVSDSTGVSVLKTAQEVYFDDKAAKPVAIHRFIGKVPVFCGGNSDGDLAMMQYTASSPYPSFCLLLHHTDSVREYAYDLHTLSGHLEEALTEAQNRGWMVVDMKTDFREIFAF